MRYCRVRGDPALGMFLVSLRPTELTDLENPHDPELVAPSGVWTITLENVGLDSKDIVEAWIQRDDTRYGYLTLGRQSYFDHAEYDEPIEDSPFPRVDQYKSMIKRAGTLNSIGTGLRAIVIGGFRRSDMKVAEYSGEGPIRATPTHTLGPDALAISDDSVEHRGVLAAGTRSGSVEALRGSSAATAVVARMVGDLLASGLSADRMAVRAAATSEEAAARPRRPKLPSEEHGGKGRLDRPALRPVRRIEE